MAKEIKCVAVGDGAVGKTSLLISYTKNIFPESYIPTVFDNYVVQLPIAKDVHTLRLFDTAGQEDYRSLRPLSYPNTDIYLVCFSVVSPDSFQNVKEQWVPEIIDQNAKALYIIVGTQIDLRDNQSAANEKGKTISKDAGKQLARDLHAVKYVECSALTKKGLKTVFDEAVLAVLNHPVGGKRKRKCSIL